MSKSSAFRGDCLKLLFNGTTITGVADNTGTSPLTSLYVALHTADPGASGTQATSECTYTGYGRQAVTRSSGAWTVTANSVSPNANITFGACTAGSETATYASIGAATSGASKIFYSGAITPSIAIANGVQPVLTTASAITET